MKLSLVFITCSIFFYSCTNSGKSDEINTLKDTAVAKNFFPVTDCLKGEIYNIKSSGVNPVRYTTINGVTDSAWVKLEQLDSSVSEFLSPQIDSANLVTLFKEKSFLDQSLNAVTFTYDPAGPLPDSMKLRHWDVYVDPKSNKVKRIYLVKQLDKNTMLQLTWVNEQWCKTTTIITDTSGAMKVVKEEKLIWDF